MDDLEEKINSVLSDPVQMQKIISIVQSLGMPPPEQTNAEPRENTQQKQESTKTQPVISESPVIPPNAAALLSQAGKLDKKQENLFNALRPFLRPARRQKFDRALQIARISHLAGFALKSRTEPPESEK